MKSFFLTQTQIKTLAELANLYPVIISDQEILYDLFHGSLKYSTWQNEQENELWIMSESNLPKLKSNKWHYRIYLNDRMLIERIMMPGLPLDRKIWQEQLSFSSVPAAGFNFRLETGLNIQFDKVDFNGNLTYPSAKIFSVDC